MLRYLPALNRIVHPINVRPQYPYVVTEHTAVTEVTKRKEKPKEKTQTTQLHAT